MIHQSFPLLMKKTVCPNLVDLYDGVLKVLQISLEGLTKLLPVGQRTSLDVTGVPQVSQLRSDPRLCLRDTNIKHLLQSQDLYLPTK